MSETMVKELELTEIMQYIKWDREMEGRENTVENLAHSFTGSMCVGVDWLERQAQGKKLLQMLLSVIEVTYNSNEDCLKDEKVTYHPTNWTETHSFPFSRMFCVYGFMLRWAQALCLSSGFILETFQC